PRQPLRRHDGRRMKAARLRLGLFAIVVALGAAAPARADAIVADLSSHLIAITGSFAGTSVVLFGATDGPGDIIATVRGPEPEMRVWRKGKVAGIWVNAESMTFANVPSFYAVAASRPLADLLAPGPAALYRIGVGNLRLDPKPTQSGERVKQFATALIDQQQRAGLMASEVGKVAFLGE